MISAVPFAPPDDSTGDDSLLLRVRFIFFVFYCTINFLLLSQRTRIFHHHIPYDGFFRFLSSNVHASTAQLSTGLTKNVCPYSFIMSVPTNVDLTVNANNFCAPRFKLVMFNYWLLNEPHIARHMYVRIYHNPYFDGSSLRNQLDNIYVEINAHPSLCKKISCQAYYPPNRSCSIFDHPMLFKSGNTDVTACEWGCFQATRNTPVYNPDLISSVAETADELYKARRAFGQNDSVNRPPSKQRNVQRPYKDIEAYHRMPLTKYHPNQQCCVMYNNALFRLGIDPRSRANKPVPRLTTIGTGDDLSDQPFRRPDGNETYRFKLNRYRCDDAKWEFHGDRCKPSLGEEIGSFFIGNFLYKTFQYLDRLIWTGIGANQNNRPNVPPVNPRNAYPNYDIWINDIDPQALPIDPFLRLSDLGIGHYGMRRFIWTTEYGSPRLIAPTLIYSAVGQVGTPSPENFSFATNERGTINPASRSIQITRRDFVAETARAAPHLKRSSNGYRVISEETLDNSVYFLSQLQKSIETPPPPEDHFGEQLREIALTLAGTGGLVITDIAVRKALKSVLNKSIAFLERHSAHIVSLTGKRLVSRTAMTMLRTITTTVFASLGIRVALMSLKVLASAFSTVLIVLDVLQFVDLIISFFDIYGLNANPPPTQEGLDVYSINELTLTERQLGYATRMLSPVNVMSIMMLARNDRLMTNTIKNNVGPSSKLRRIDPARFATLYSLLHGMTQLQMTDSATVSRLQQNYPKHMFSPERLPGGWTQSGSERYPGQNAYRPGSSNGINISFHDVRDPNDPSVMLELNSFFIDLLAKNSEGQPIDYTNHADDIYIANGLDGVKLPPVSFEDLYLYTQDGTDQFENLVKTTFEAATYTPETDPLKSSSLIGRVNTLRLTMGLVSITVPLFAFFINSPMVLVLYIVAAFLCVHALFTIQWAGGLDKMVQQIMDIVPLGSRGTAATN